MRALLRLREPSTWAGVAALAAIWRPELGEAIPALGTTLATAAASILGLVAIAKKDPGSRS